MASEIETVTDEFVNALADFLQAEQGASKAYRTSLAASFAPGKDFRTMEGWPS